MFFFLPKTRMQRENSSIIHSCTDVIIFFGQNCSGVYHNIKKKAKMHRWNEICIRMNAKMLNAEKGNCKELILQRSVAVWTR